MHPFPEDYGWPADAPTTGFFEFSNTSQHVCHEAGVRPELYDWHNGVFEKEVAVANARWPIGAGALVRDRDPCRVLRVPLLTQ